MSWKKWRGIAIAFVLLLSLPNCAACRTRSEKDTACPKQPNCGQCITQQCGWCAATKSCTDLDPNTDQPRTACTSTVVMSQQACSDLSVEESGAKQ